MYSVRITRRFYSVERTWPFNAFRVRTQCITVHQMNTFWWQFFVKIFKTNNYLLTNQVLIFPSNRTFQSMYERWKFKLRTFGGYIPRLSLVDWYGFLKPRKVLYSILTSHVEHFKGNKLRLYGLMTDVISSLYENMN